MSSPDARFPDDGSDRLTVAAVQITSGDDRAVNIARARDLVGEAARGGARRIVLPEKWPHLHGPRTAEGAEPLDGPSVSAAAAWARELDVAIVAGSITEGAQAGRVHNTSVLLAPGGGVVAVYRKIHMFDVDVDGRSYRESAVTAPGTETVAADVLGRRVGMSICYDLRFPELYRRLASAGAQLLVVPAAFTDVTGRAHWETLLRARAIENQAFVIAAGQVGRHADGTLSHGHSMIVDAWGTVLAEAPEGEGVAVATLDFAALADIRRRLPALAHRRDDLA
jgi:predicted amidohydrolase